MDVMTDLVVTLHKEATTMCVTQGHISKAEDGPCIACTAEVLMPVIGR